MSHFIKVGHRVVNVDHISAMSKSGAETLVLLDGAETMSLPVAFDEVCKAIRLPKRTVYSGGVPMAPRAIHFWVDIETGDDDDEL